MELHRRPGDCGLGTPFLLDLRGNWGTIIEILQYHWLLDDRKWLLWLQDRPVSGRKVSRSRPNRQNRQGRGVVLWFVYRAVDLRVPDPTEELFPNSAWRRASETARCAGWFGTNS
jgi:hypothetical protein